MIEFIKKKINYLKKVIGEKSLKEKINDLEVTMFYEKERLNFLNHEIYLLEKSKLDRPLELFLFKKTRRKSKIMLKIFSQKIKKYKKQENQRLMKEENVIYYTYKKNLNYLKSLDMEFSWIITLFLLLMLIKFIFFFNIAGSIVSFTLNYLYFLWPTIFLIWCLTLYKVRFSRNDEHIKQNKLSAKISACSYLYRDTLAYDHKPKNEHNVDQFFSFYRKMRSFRCKLLRANSRCISERDYKIWSWLNELSFPEYWGELFLNNKILFILSWFVFLLFSFSPLFFKLYVLEILLIIVIFIMLFPKTSRIYIQAFRSWFMPTIHKIDYRIRYHSYLKNYLDYESWEKEIYNKKNNFIKMLHFNINNEKDLYFIMRIEAYIEVTSPENIQRLKFFQREKELLVLKKKSEKVFLKYHNQQKKKLFLKNPKIVHESKKIYIQTAIDLKTLIYEGLEKEKEVNKLHKELNLITYNRRIEKKYLESTKMQRNFMKFCDFIEEINWPFFYEIIKNIIKSIKNIFNKLFTLLKKLINF